MKSNSRKTVLICAERLSSKDIVETILHDLKQEGYKCFVSTSMPTVDVFSLIKRSANVIFLLEKDSICSMNDKKNRIASFIKYADKEQKKITFIRFKGFKFPKDTPKKLDLEHSVIYEQEYAEFIVQELIIKGFISSPGLIYHLKKNSTFIGYSFFTILLICLFYYFSVVLPMKRDDQRLTEISNEASIAFENDEFDRALNHCGEALVYKNADKNRIYTIMGNIYREREDIPNSYLYYRRAILENTKCVEPYFKILTYTHDFDKEEWGENFMKEMKDNFFYYFIPGFQNLKNKKDLRFYLDEGFYSFLTILASEMDSRHCVNRNEILRTIVDISQDEQTQCLAANMLLYRLESGMLILSDPSSVEKMTEDQRFGYETLENLVKKNPGNRMAKENLAVYLQYFDKKRSNRYTEELLRDSSRNGMVVSMYLETLSRNRDERKLDSMHMLEMSSGANLNANHYNSWGGYYKNVNNKKSLDFYQKAYELNPYDTTIVRNLYLMYYRLGDFSNYQKYLRKSAELGELRAIRSVKEQRQRK